MGLLTFAGRIVLAVINISFMLLSLALIIGGFVIRFANEYLKTFAKDILNKIQSTVETIDNTTISTNNFELGSVLGKVATAMILVGLVLLAFSFVGCCGACYSCTTIMLVYSIVLIALLVVQVILVILVFGASTVIKQKLKTEMLHSIDEYNGLKGTTLISLTWNWAMQQFDCCGANSYEDFPVDSWKISIEINCITPIACCKVLPKTTTELNACAGNTVDNTYNTTNKIHALSNYNTGCVDQIWSNVMVHKRWFGIVIGFCFAFQITLILFACLVFKNRGIAGGLI